MNVRSLEILLLLLAAVQRCSGFCSRPVSCTRATAVGISTPYTSQSLRRHLSSDDNNNNDDDDDDEQKQKSDGKKEKDDTVDGYTWAELQADPELSKFEFKSSMKRKNKMFLGQNISRAITTLGWAFVIGGFVLNSVGYAWVKNPAGGLGVGTLDERDFQREIMREERRANNEDANAKEEKSTSLSLSKAETSEHILAWIDQQGDTATV